VQRDLKISYDGLTLKHCTFNPLARAPFSYQ